jgi:hypothetical protein
VPLADDFYLLAHDERGKPRLQARATAIGLAAGVLSELILTGHLSIRDSWVVIGPAGSATVSTVEQRIAALEASHYPPPGDSVAHAVFEQIKHEPGIHHVRTWLGVLAPAMNDAVASRLLRLGLVRTEQVGRLRRVMRYVPTDVNAGANVSVRLAYRLTHQDPNLSWDDAVLVGLIKATGLLDDVLYDDPTGAGHQYMAHVMRQVGTHVPALIELFAHTEAAVGDAVITHRT